MLFRNKFRVESARLKEWDYSTPWWYYVTINTIYHICFLGEIKNGKMVLNPAGEIVTNEWLNTPNIRKNVELDYFIVMPNHLHGIVIINGSELAETHIDASLQMTLINSTGEMIPDLHDIESEAGPKLVKNNLKDIIRGFKSSAAKKLHQNGITNFHWQPRFYDRIIRNENELNRIRKYIEQNPLRWELEKDNPENLDF
jgi:putative transposase